MKDFLISTTRSSLQEYQNNIDPENAVKFGIIFLFFFAVLWFSLALRRKNGVKSPKRDRTTRYERQLSNPDINTNNWGLHKKRLEIHGTSTFRGTIFYVGPKGGVYYISYNGKKIY